MDQLFQYSTIRDHEYAGEFIEYLARKLTTDLSQVPVLLTTQNNHPTQDLKNLAHLVFESKNSPALFFVRKGVSVLFANGKTNGINLESSHNQTHIVPVHDGYSLRKHMRSFRIGGKIVNDYVADLIRKQTKNDKLIPSLEIGFGNSAKHMGKLPTQSFRQFAEQKMLRNIKPVLSKLRLVKQAE